MACSVVTNSLLPKSLCLGFFGWISLWLEAGIATRYQSRFGNVTLRGGRVFHQPQGLTHMHNTHSLPCVFIFLKLVKDVYLPLLYNHGVLFRRPLPKNIASHSHFIATHCNSALEIRAHAHTQLQLTPQHPQLLHDLIPGIL